MVVFVRLLMVSVLDCLALFFRGRRIKSRLSYDYIVETIW